MTHPTHLTPQDESPISPTSLPRDRGSAASYRESLHKSVTSHYSSADPYALLPSPDAEPRSSRPLLGAGYPPRGSLDMSADMDRAKIEQSGTGPRLIERGASSPTSLPPDMRRASLHVNTRPVGRRRYFEPVHWPHVALLLLAVGVCWPLGQFVPPHAVYGLNLNLARFIIAVIGVFIGLVCGFVLLSIIGRRLYSAVVYSSLVHQEMALHELDNVGELGFMSALLLLKYRLLTPPVRRSQRSYDPMPWSLYILFFLGLFLLAAEGSFLYNRVVILRSINVLQTDRYHPIPVLGELIQNDTEYAGRVYPSFFSDADWTVASLASLTIPTTSNLYFDTGDGAHNASITFTEALPYLFSPTAVGPAASLWRAFQTTSGYGQATTVSNDALISVVAQGDVNVADGRARVPVAADYSAWGARVACSTVREVFGTIVQQSGTGDTYLSVSNGTVIDLLGKVGASGGLANSGELSWTVPQNISTLVPGGIVQGPWSDDGVSSSIQNVVLDNGESGSGYVVLNFVLARLNQTLAPGGNFYTSYTGTGGSIGVDGGVCVTRISQYMVRAVDNAGVVALVQVLGEGNQFTSASSGNERLAPLFESTTQPLTSAGKQQVFNNALRNVQNQLLKDNARDARYQPNPTLVQMTVIDPVANTPPIAYGMLNATKIDAVLRSANSRYLLMYLVGAGRVEGRAFVYDSLARAEVSTPWMAALMGAFLLSGLLACFFVPRLPFNLPPKNIAPSGWLATFADQLPPQHDETHIQGLKVRYGR